MPFKTGENGAIILNENGLPLFVGPDGAEKPYDVDARVKQIAELTEKANKRGRELEELKARYSGLAEIEDIAAYIEEHRKNAETVASLADKDREKEANVQKRIAEAVKAATGPLSLERDDLKAKLAKSEESLGRAVIGNAFATSAYVNERLQGAALAQKLYGDRFYAKDGRAVARDDEGNDIYGTDGLATFDEALSRLVEGSPFKDVILKPAPGGSGAKDGANLPPKGSGKLSREQAENLSPADYAKARKEGRI